MLKFSAVFHMFASQTSVQRMVDEWENVSYGVWLLISSFCRRCRTSMFMSTSLKVLPWVVDGAGGLRAGKTGGAGTRGVDLNAAVGGRTGYTDTNGGKSGDNGGKIHADCYPAKNPSL